MAPPAEQGAAAASQLAAELAAVQAGLAAVASSQAELQAAVAAVAGAPRGAEERMSGDAVEGAAASGGDGEGPVGHRGFSGRVDTPAVCSLVSCVCLCFGTSSVHCG